MTMPAVSSFALYAAIAVFADFLLQITGFMACLVLDTFRAESGRVDCFPFIRISGAEENNTVVHTEPFLQRFFRKYFAPTILQPWMRYFDWNNQMLV